ncbi:MAG: DUF2240 family protein [Candidatus Aenigmatarchaeota archaeon]|nr:DUF2240 family protein [Candidatus Aenigmarchaeota archaeon]
MSKIDEIIQNIKEKTGLSEEEIDKKISETQEKLSFMVTREGAAYIVANELGLNIKEQPKSKIEIKNIISGINNLNLVARVLSISEPKEYNKNGKVGKVQYMILGDKTGKIRLVAWNDQIEILNGIKVGDKIKIEKAFTKDDGKGRVEIRITKNTIIEHTDEEIPEIKLEVPKIKLCQIKENELVKVRAALVQMFEIEPFYYACPNCRSRVRVSNEKYICKIHGEVIPEKSIFISGVIDDGTDNMRAIFFTKPALKIINLNSVEDAYIKGAEGILKIVKNILGKEFIIQGRVRKNKFYDRMEFIVTNVEEVNVQKEIEELLNNIIKG